MAGMAGKSLHKCDVDIDICIHNIWAFKLATQEHLHNHGQKVLLQRKQTDEERSLSHIIYAGNIKQFDSVEV